MQLQPPQPPPQQAQQGSHRSSKAQKSACWRVQEVSLCEFVGESAVGGGVQHVQVAPQPMHLHMGGGEIRGDQGEGG